MTDATASSMLVPYAGACAHTPPPPLNQLGQVIVHGRVRVPVSWWTPVYIKGELTVRLMLRAHWGSVSAYNTMFTAHRALSVGRKRVFVLP